MKRLVLILLLLVTAASLGAAPSRFLVEGTVTDSNSGAPLAGVVVELGPDYLWAVTDSDGNYTFKDVEKGTYTIKAVFAPKASTSVE